MRGPRSKARDFGALALAAIVAAACHDSDDFLPTEPRLDQYLQLVTENGETTLPADGISRLRLIARISPESDLDKRTIVFSTSAGTLIGGIDGAGGKEVTADSSGQASIQLQSSQRVEDAEVRAQSKEVAGLARQLVIAFVEADPDTVIRFTASPSSAPADGATRSAFTVAISPSLPLGTTVKFKSVSGTFADNQMKEVDVTADASFTATAELVSSTEIDTDRVTAIANNVSRETFIDFVRALPDRIIVTAEPSTVAAGTNTPVTITATLLRDRGTVTDDTVVTFEATAGSFEDVTRSQADADAATATATFLPGGETPAGSVTITVGTDPASVTESVDVEIVP